MPIAQSRIFFQERPGRPAVLAMRRPSVRLRWGRFYLHRRDAIADGRCRRRRVAACGPAGYGDGGPVEAADEEADAVSGEPERRFADALAKAREEWAAADAAACAARAGGEWADGAVRVPLFGRPHVVTHPGGEVLAAPGRARARRRRHPPAALPPGGRRHAAGGRVERVPRAARRALLRGVVRAARGAAARARVRRVRRRAWTRSARPRARPAATRSRWATRRSASSPCRAWTSPCWSGPATTRSPGRPACCSTPARATTSPAEDLAGLGGQLAHRLVAASRR